ncbi:LysR family transcriptional regulator [Trinickia fusca]|uniref:LysR family transcriptional regulator n=1 Tax=Trinickia fusca TaxID=2419777 RepID=A0A494XF55_9BURK|nr:LysR family transcriptional regulator [Trinickia fusca]RKP49138.1 LysR family transcriptional regulator [Trinickia fusca]
MDRLGDIRLFVEAARLGGISAAGRKLGVTPAAASARLAKLEAALATRLFERTTRQLRLTDEGRLYLRHCMQALQALDDADAALQAGRNVVSGKIRISTTSDFGRNLLMAWLDEFNALHPDVTFALSLSDSVSDLLNDDLDLAIRFGAPREDCSLVARRLASNRRVLVASPDYLARHGRPTSPADLARFDCIVLVIASGPLNEWRFVRGDETEQYTVPLERSRETNDGAVTRTWAIDGYGIVLKSLWDIDADLRTGRLQVVLPEWRYAPDSPLHALFHRNRYRPPRVRALLDFLIERFACVERDWAGLPGIDAAAGGPPAAPGKAERL